MQTRLLNNSVLALVEQQVAYNSRHNEPLPGAPEGQPKYNQINVVPDSNIVKVGVKGIDPSKNKMLEM